MQIDDFSINYNDERRRLEFHLRNYDDDCAWVRLTTARGVELFRIATQRSRYNNQWYGFDMYLPPGIYNIWVGSGDFAAISYSKVFEVKKPAPVTTGGVEVESVGGAQTQQVTVPPHDDGRCKICGFDHDPGVACI